MIDYNKNKNKNNNFVLPIKGPQGANNLIQWLKWLETYKDTCKHTQNKMNCELMLTYDASYRYAILWEAFLGPSDSYFLFADLVGVYTHWTYMHIFRHNFLSNYWWQKSDIWSQASYRYPISWEAFFDPSDSYFLFAKERGYHRWALAHSSSCFAIFYCVILGCSRIEDWNKFRDVCHSCRCWGREWGRDIFFQRPFICFSDSSLSISFLIFSIK
jgi:hypothetical protein